MKWEIIMLGFQVQWSDEVALAEEAIALVLMYIVIVY